MAVFNASFTAVGYTSAELNAVFTGGDPDYANYRRIELVTHRIGELYQSHYILSNESSGADNTFSGIISGLRSGETYTWTATLQYYDAAGWHSTPYGANGTVTMPVPPPVEDVILWVYTGGQWKQARPWIYTSGWKQAEPWIYFGRWRN